MPRWRDADVVQPEDEIAWDAAERGLDPVRFAIEVHEDVVQIEGERWHVGRLDSEISRIENLGGALTRDVFAAQQRVRRIILLTGREGWRRTWAILLETSARCVLLPLLFPQSSKFREFVTRWSRGAGISRSARRDRQAYPLPAKVAGFGPIAAVLSVMRRSFVAWPPVPSWSRRFFSAQGLRVRWPSIFMPPMFVRCALFAFIAAPLSVAPAGAAKIGADCTLKGFPLRGKVQVVESFPDIKVQIVTSFPDLKVKVVESFPDDCGEWQMVDSFPDFKIQFVDSFPDLKVEMVDSFPGVP
jgi:hypothetical protein